jgi:hypothetical protein
MSADEPSETEIREAQMIVIGAMAAAGNMNSSIAWKGRINALIPEVAAVLGSRSSQMRRALAMSRATIFTAPFAKAELEPSSTRMIVSLEHGVDKDHPDGFQHIRTERTDSQTGKRMAEKLKEVKPGNTLLCWKVLEEIRGGDNAGRNVAILMHVEVLPDRAAGGNTGVSGSNGTGGAAATSTPPPTSGRDLDVEMEAFSALTKDWESRNVAVFVADLRTRGLWPPTATTIDAILKEGETWTVSPSP